MMTCNKGFLGKENISRGERSVTAVNAAQFVQIKFITVLKK